ncbi:diaminopimelate epimerase [Oleispirillum naphthae]|uniref:diaminopimelate epimerase n=1 Tax=Oleispirillum naphthae TaxID=2838853 RepID=UPI00308242B7
MSTHDDLCALAGRRFRKMHGLGNDFVVIDARAEPLTLSPAAAAALADRRSGVGCDQAIVIEPGDGEAAAFMRIYNADGSEVSACGNATRCVARLLMEEAGTAETTLRTRAGLIRAFAGKDGLITADMGPAGLDWRAIPLAEAHDTLALPLAAGGYGEPVAVSMGNPHAVFFVHDAEAVALSAIGPVIEVHPMFPEKTNVEFAHLIAPDRIRMRVWERGTGITRACGTGACATAVAAARRGLAGRASEVVLDGGSLFVEWTEDGRVLMTGPATLAFTGTLGEILPAGKPA